MYIRYFLVIFLFKTVDAFPEYFCDSSPVDGKDRDRGDSAARSRTSGGCVATRCAWATGWKSLASSRLLASKWC